MPGALPPGNLLVQQRQAQKKRRQLDAHERQSVSRPTPSRKHRDPILGFLHTAASVGKTVAETAEKLPVVQVGKMFAKGDVKGIVNELGEETGINSIRRIRKGKGGIGDYAGVGLMALPVVGRAASRGASPVFGIISPPARRHLIGKGEAIIKTPEVAKKIGPVENMDLPHVQETISKHMMDQFAGLPVSWAGIPKKTGKIVRLRVKPENIHHGDQAVINRAAFFTDPQTGNIYIHHNMAGTHGDLRKELISRGLPPGRVSSFKQGWIIHPHKDFSRIDFGWGPSLGTPAPKNTEAAHQLLALVSRGKGDEALTSSAREAMGLSGAPARAQSLDDVMEQWVRDVEQGHAYVSPSEVLEIERKIDMQLQHWVDNGVLDHDSADRIFESLVEADITKLQVTRRGQMEVSGYGKKRFGESFDIVEGEHRFPEQYDVRGHGQQYKGRDFYADFASKEKMRKRGRKGGDSFDSVFAPQYPSPLGRKEQAIGMGLLYGSRYKKQREKRKASYVRGLSNHPR